MTTQTLAARADGSRSYYEATARQRVAGLFDAGSIREILPPQERVVSPHLPTLGIPVAFDDGVMIGRARLDGSDVLFAAEEPGFMGGSVGEVHGAKLTGLLKLAARDKPAAVVLLWDTGGVRLHEANAGLISISEIQRAVFEVRAAGVPIIVVCAGANGCYGGLGIVARCCDHIVMTEEGRHSVSGPEVIESQKGVEEFDARDRALVWRTMGGKHRYLLGEAGTFARDTMEDLRGAIGGLLGQSVPLSLDAVLREHRALARRLERFGATQDAMEIWGALGVEDPAAVPMLDTEAFVAMANTVRERADA
ncbi:biotin-independent malonate decarboxylase subunit beta (plasmid) [Cupriavidus sp. P-10]|uniref:biotin-independent malonate decarboxylase subunit beta n=1 Tax=Cupriavidus sp. P-10 TaxID=2027911 RepID=UPI000E2F3387|nr:biotin-independent malonate decarboxylase subunit beta [Cupriavidus sp. P-10]BDB30015.1 biotin-independent malonate decarboxylase subunit beta [Cupriavidus sp. P-10]